MEAIGDRLLALGGDYDVFSLVDFTKAQASGSEQEDPSTLRLLNDRKSLVLASTSRVIQQDKTLNTVKEFALERRPFTRSPYVRYIDPSITDDWLVVTGIENALFLDTLSGREVKSIPIPGAGANYVSFDPHGAALWIANNYRLMRYDLHLPELWRSTRKREQASILDPTTGLPIALTGMFSERDVFIRVDRMIDNVNNERGRIELANVPRNSTSIEQLYLALDGKVEEAPAELIAGLHYGMAIWNSAEGRLDTTPVQFKAEELPHASAIKLSPDSSHYWIGDSINKSGRLQVKRVSDGATVQSMSNADSAMRIRVGGYEDIACGEKRTVTVCDDHQLRVFDSVTFELLSTIDLTADTIPKVVVLNAAESVAFVGAQEGHLLAIDLSNERIKTVAVGGSEITALATCTNGVLAVGFHSGEIDLWSTGSGSVKRMCRLGRMSNSINQLEFSQDGSQLALQVQGEQSGRLLDWNAFRARLREFELDWE